MQFVRTLGALFVLCAIVACSGNAGNAPTTLTVDGSTALQPLVTQAAADYAAKHPEVTIDVKGGGSAKGIFDVSSHSVDIGDSDVDAAAADLTDHQVAVVAFAVVHGPNAGVESLTIPQIASIFNGKVTNWKQLGGHDQPIAVVNRPLGSGTRRVFSTVFMGGREPSNVGTIIDSSEQVSAKVKNTAGAVSYVGLSYATKYNLPMIAVGGVVASIPNIRNRSYGFWSYEHMYTTAKSSPAAEAFIDYVRSDDAIIDKLGFIAIKDVAKSAIAAPSAQ